MISVDNATMLLDQGEVVGSDGERIGKVGQVYVDNQSGQLSWVTVKTGWFGTNESFVPLDNAHSDGNVITVPYDKDMVKGAPNHDVGTQLSVEDEADLYSYYGLRLGGYETSTGTGTENVAVADTAYATRADTTRADTAETTTGASADTTGYMTRSEEQLHVGTEKVVAGRARLKKFVVTEQQTVTVPVSHEEVRVVRETLQPGEAAGAVIGEDAVEVTLMQDKVVVAKEAVAVEKISLDTELVTEQQQVTESVRKEQIEVHTDDAVTTGYGDLETESSRTTR